MKRILTAAMIAAAAVLGTPVAQADPGWGDDDCDCDEVCTGGECTNEDVCSTNADCDTGEQCVDSMCVDDDEVKGHLRSKRSSLSSERIKIALTLPSAMSNRPPSITPPLNAAANLSLSSVAKRCGRRSPS